MSVRIRETGRIDILLSTMPADLRSKHLRRALGDASRKLARVVRALAPVDDEDEEEIHIKDHVRTRTFERGQYEIVGRTSVKGLPAGYALALEYGHQMFLWGQMTDQQVAPTPFFRPAIDQTETDREMGIIAHLRRTIRELVRV